MKVDTEQVSGATIAKATGRIDSTNARVFDDALEAIIDASSEALIVDLATLSYISSAGLRVILLTAKTLQKHGRDFMLCSLSDSIKELFEVSGFDKIIEIHTSRDEALAALKG